MSYQPREGLHQMKLRSILKVLSLLAIVFACTAGYSYYASLKKYAIEEAHRRAMDQLETTKKNLSSFLSENVSPVRVLAGMHQLGEILTRPGDSVLFDEVNSLLDHFTSNLGVDVCYLMDRTGTTIASSNREAPDSFVGQNFSFRPYFVQAMQGLPSTYLALGTTSRKRGAYYSYPVYAKGDDIPIGIAVIKASIFFVERELLPRNVGIELVVDPNGVVFISNQREWLYHILWKPTVEKIEQIRSSRQFGAGPWPWAGIKRVGNEYAVDRDGIKFFIYEKEIDHYPGWKIVHLSRVEDASKFLSSPFIKVIGPVLITFCIMIGIVIFILYRMASSEILQRKAVQKELAKSEERFRSLYHNTPAMLHSIDKNGRIVSVSDYWSEVMGYSRASVIGKKLTDFMADSSKAYAEEKVFPEFFKTGYLKDIQYTFVKNNGEEIDVLLSAISDKDDRTASFRSLAVFIDVTERKKAEEALRLAKEALSSYSKDLEKTVRKRTREITSILRYTPAVVYIKDTDGRYLLVNSKFEQLFQVKSDDVRGKSDYDVLPHKVAKQFREHDKNIPGEKRSYQVEEHIDQDDGVHTYLSIKFPIYDEIGDVRGICGIATDITELKKAQDRLRRLSGSIMEGQEKERAYLARELHDELGQLLTALRMEAVWLKDKLKAIDKSVSDRALTMCGIIDKTIEEVRGIALRLRPGVLDHLGIVDALEWYTSDFERRYGITCVFKHVKIPEIQGALATAAYRIVQEALTNVARHASASRVRVWIQHKSSILDLSIADNGVGFDPASLSDMGCLGMEGMKERALLVGGTLEVKSGPDKGTLISFRVAIPDH